MNYQITSIKYSVSSINYQVRQCEKKSTDLLAETMFEQCLKAVSEKEKKSKK